MYFLQGTISSILAPKSQLPSFISYRHLLRTMGDNTSCVSYGLYFMESLKMFLKLVIVAKQYSALNSSICLFLLSCYVL